MHPAHLSKRLGQVDARIIALCQQIADTTGQEYHVPEGFENWTRDGSTPADVQMLHLGELFAEALRLLVTSLPVAVE